MLSTKKYHGANNHRANYRRVIAFCVTSRGLRVVLGLFLSLSGTIAVGSTNAQILLAQSAPSTQIADTQAADTQLFMPMLHDATRAAQPPTREDSADDEDSDTSIPPENNPDGNHSGGDSGAPVQPHTTTTNTNTNTNTNTVTTTIVVDPAPENHESPVGSTIPNLSYCPDSNTAETALATAMFQHLAQGRAAMQCDPVLMAVARHRATDMAVRDYIAHQTPEGLGPNQLAFEAGYPLPADYSLANGSNNIESIAAGNANPLGVWETWLSLETHRVHLLGLDTFFAHQTYYGIGYVYVPGSTYRHYWVVLTAPAPETNAGGTGASGD